MHALVWLGSALLRQLYSFKNWFNKDMNYEFTCVAPSHVGHPVVHASRPDQLLWNNTSLLIQLIRRHYLHS